MKNIIKLTGLCAALSLASSAFAQASNFEGFSVYAATGYNSWKPSLSNLVQGGKDQALSFGSLESAATPLFLGVEYTMPVSKDFTIGLSWESDMLEGKQSSATVSKNNVLVPDTAIKNIVKSGAYQISLTPGMVMAPNALLYGKVGYYSVTNSFNLGNDVPLSFTSTGYGLGAGLKYMVTKNIFGFGEFNTRIAASKSQSVDSGTFDLKVDGMSALAGIGWKF